MALTKFSKLLVARHSPENGCYAAEGTVLFVKAKPKVPMKTHVNHVFLSADDPKLKSKYGWVAEAAPFDLEEFVARHHLDGLSDEDRGHLITMFESIANLAPGVPVASGYSSRGVENPRMEFTVHRVWFHKA